MLKPTLLLLFLAYRASSQSGDKYNCLCVQGFCDDGWTQYMNSCYKPFTEGLLWSEAEAACLSNNSHLASVHSREENEFVFNLMGRPQNQAAGEAYWLGGHDSIKEGTHMWTDGTRMEFFQFGLGQPDNPGIEHYIGSWYIENGNITWNDYPGHCTFPFVCKYTIGNRLCQGK